MNYCMASGTIRLKGRELLEKYSKTMYRLEKNKAATRPTILKYINRPEEIDSYSARVVYGILVDGLELSPEQVADMRFGDIFDLLSDEMESPE